MLAAVGRLHELWLDGLEPEMPSVAYTVSPWSRLAELVGRPRWNFQWGALAAPLISAVMHAVALWAFALLTIPVQVKPEAPMLTVSEATEEPEFVREPELEMARADDEPQDSVLSALAMSVAPVQSDTAELFNVTPPNNLDTVEVEIASLDPLEGMLQSDSIVREGSAGDEVQHVEGAVDRLTHEIATSLEKDDVLVVWLMDASISLIPERKEIAARLDRIYKEVEQLGGLSRKALLSAVVRFGEKTQELVPPTSDGAKIVAGIKDLETDEAGIENVFSTVVAAVERYKTYRTHERRKVMVIIWTDESGDDYAQSGKAVELCRRLSIPVFTVGPSAMFGLEMGTQAYKHPEDGQTYFLPVNRGPDSVRQERIDVPFWFEGPQLDKLHSGMGPYALSWLSRETGGAYLIKEQEADRSPFKFETMRRYMPEYVSPAEYMEQVAKHPMRQAILKAVDITRERKMKETPRLSFAPTGENFQQQLREAQETVAYNSMILDEALTVFGPKGMETMYQAETSPRWQAWYDLSFGRLLAMRVRCNEYNWACATMKGKGSNFVDKESNRWEFVPDAKLNFGSSSEKPAAEATRLLMRCIQNNAGTPWAALAQRELQNPFGFKVEETYVAPPPPPKIVANPNPPPPPPVAGRPMEQPLKLQRPVAPKLPRL